MPSDSEREALKACPFCGGGSVYRDPHRGGEWSHDAPDCFLNGVYIAGQHSIEQWNTRTPPIASEPRGEGVRAVSLALRRQAKALVAHNALAEKVGSARQLLMKGDWDVLARAAITAYREGK